VCAAGGYDAAQGASAAACIRRTRVLPRLPRRRAPKVVGAGKLRMHTYVYTYVHAYVCACVNSYMHTYIHVYICILLSTYIHVYIYISISVLYLSIYLSTYLPIYLSIYVSMYLCIYLYSDCLQKRCNRAQQISSAAIPCMH
jgi:hypothetical protein